MTDITTNPEICDDIQEAMFDAVCDADGRCDQKHLQAQLAKRGLRIVPILRPGEYIEVRTGLRIIRHKNGIQPWRYADAESERLAHQMDANCHDWRADGYLSDARYLRSALSGSGEAWWKKFDDLCHATRMAIEERRRARASRAAASSVGSAA